MATFSMNRVKRDVFMAPCLLNTHFDDFIGMLHVLGGLNHSGLSRSQVRDYFGSLEQIGKIGSFRHIPLGASHKWDSGSNGPGLNLLADEMHRVFMNLGREPFARIKSADSDIAKASTSFLSMERQMMGMPNAGEVLRNSGEQKQLLAALQKESFLMKLDVPTANGTFEECVFTIPNSVVGKAMQEVLSSLLANSRTGDGEGRMMEYLWAVAVAPEGILSTRPAARLILGYTGTASQTAGVIKVVMEKLCEQIDSHTGLQNAYDELFFHPLCESIAHAVDKNKAQLAQYASQSHIPAAQHAQAWLKWIGYGVGQNGELLPTPERMEYDVQRLVGLEGDSIGGEEMPVKPPPGNKTATGFRNRKGRQR